MELSHQWSCRRYCHQWSSRATFLLQSNPIQSNPFSFPLLSPGEGLGTKSSPRRFGSLAFHEHVISEGDVAVVVLMSEGLISFSLRVVNIVGRENGRPIFKYIVPACVTLVAIT
ncbi:hypothetical protein OIU77_020048 [Salix suchowensis]|uniref:Uncharacterized protein n=1 Tax=Salix suchowensis TaxID=1278906 RepID=A0ABQ9CLS9_9ROSI|nr:hypothetical protein OIU77_020048 [Salix suchowensis]